MNKAKLPIIFSLLLLISTSALAVNRAVEIGIGGIGSAVDGAALRTVQQVIGGAVANGVIDNFKVSGYGIEGGFSACAQASPFTKEFGAFVQQLRTIKPNPFTTAYSVRPVANCSDSTTVCTQDAKLCPNGSYVSRVAPSCAFAPCPR